MRQLKYLVLLLPLFLGGCAAEYKAKQEADIQIATVQEVNRARAVQSIMKVVIDSFEAVKITQVEKRKAGAVVEEPMPIGEPMDSDSDIQYAFFVMGSVFQQSIEMSARVQIAQARMQAIVFMRPIIEALYPVKSGRKDPITVNGVLSKLVDQVPFMSAMGGMYGLGVEGVQSAGDIITSTINGDNNATGSKSSGDASTQQPVTTTTETTTTTTTTKD